MTTAVCVSVCLSVLRRIPTLLRWPGCNFGGMVGVPLFLYCWANLPPVLGFVAIVTCVPNAKCQRGRMYLMYGCRSTKPGLFHHQSNRPLRVGYPLRYHNPNPNPNSTPPLDFHDSLYRICWIIVLADAMTSFFSESHLYRLTCFYERTTLTAFNWTVAK